MERKAFMCDMIRTELEDIVGVENVSTKRQRPRYLRRGLFLDRPYVGGSRPDPAHARHASSAPAAPRKSPRS